MNAETSPIVFLPLQRKPLIIKIVHIVLESQVHKHLSGDGVSARFDVSWKSLSTCTVYVIWVKIASEPPSRT